MHEHKHDHKHALHNAHLIRRFFCLGILIGAALTASVTFIAPYLKQSTVRVGVEDYAPFISLDSSGDMIGVSATVLKLIASEHTMVLKPTHPQQLTTLMRMLEEGEIDLVTSVKRTPEREKVALFTRPYITVRSSIISSVNDPKTVCVGAGFAIESFMRETTQLNVLTAATDKDCLQLMATKKVDAAAMDDFTLGTLQIQASWFSKRLDFSYPLSFAVSKKRPELVKLLNAAIVD